MFLENGGEPDPYYRRKREKVHFFMIECCKSFENCFCVAMKSNRTENYAAAIRFNHDEILIKISDKRFLPYFSGEQTDFEPEFVSQDEVLVELPQNGTMPPEIFSHKMWQEYDQRCIACGRCNTSCVTCTCFSTIDIHYPDSRGCGERRRVWDGCHLDGFTEMAGGHSFRKNKGERMRFKTMHKIYDFRKRFGFDMCVGCGRCDDVCPEYISFSSCINRLTSTLKGLENEE
jgi:anaerobic sulfite reductase subunit A